MTYKGFLLGASALATLGLAACASAMNGGTQTTEVVVRGSAGAYCEFTNTRFRNAGQFPNTVTLERSREDLVANCVGDEGRKVKFTIPSIASSEGTAGNLATGVLPGAAYDSLMGSMWAYPDPIIVDFRQVGPGQSVEWPADKDVKNKDRQAFFQQVKGEMVEDTSVTLDIDPTVSARETATPVVIDAVTLAVDAPHAQKPAAAQAVQPKPLVSPIVDEVEAKPVKQPTTQPVAQPKPAAAVEKEVQEQALPEQAAQISEETVNETVIEATTAPAAAPVAAPVVEPATPVAEPIISPEDHMGLHPARVKAEAEAKRKAAEQAKAERTRQAAEAKALAKAKEEAQHAAQQAEIAERSLKLEAESAVQEATRDVKDTATDVQQAVEGAVERVEGAIDNAAPTLPDPFASEFHAPQNAGEHEGEIAPEEIPERYSTPSQ